MLEHEPLYFSAFHPWSLSLMMIPSIFPKPNLHIATGPSFVPPGKLSLQTLSLLELSLSFKICPQVITLGESFLISQLYVMRAEG